MSNFIEDIKNYMRDKPQLNRLLAAQETHDSTYSLCIEHAIDLWNGTPPLTVSTISVTTSGAVIINNTSYDIKIISYSSSAKGLLLEGSCIEILKSVLLLRNRNNLSYSDGNISVQEEVGPIEGYFRMLQLFISQYERKLRDYKLAENMNQLLGTAGGLGTDYSWFPNYDIWNYISI